MCSHAVVCSGVVWLDVFPPCGRPYPNHNAYAQMRVLTCFNKAALETLCQLHLIPSIVVTNDWFTGLAPAFARHGHFGNVFDGTDFMHICHNLDPSYEGRLYPEKHEVRFEFVVHLAVLYECVRLMDMVSCRVHVEDVLMDSVCPLALRVCCRAHWSSCTVCRPTSLWTRTGRTSSSTPRARHSCARTRGRRCRAATEQTCCRRRRSRSARLRSCG